MKLGLSLGYSGAKVSFPIELVKQAEKLGYDSVWTAEAYGSDAMTPLAWIAAQTSRIKLGTGIVQLAGRTPAMCAMQAMTIDGLAGGGRMIVGLGVSGPQIVEGWYGQPWGKPYYRVRDYVEIMQKIFRREGPVSHDGREISLPYTGEGATGLGKPLFSIVHRPRPSRSSWAAETPCSGCAASCATACCRCGSFPPRRRGSGAPSKKALPARVTASPGTRSPSSRGVVTVTDDVKSALAAQKPRIALYVGGMGHPSVNFHKQAMEQLGYADAAARIEELFRAGRKDEAADAVPDEFVDNAALIGTPQRIRERYQVWADCDMVTGLHIGTQQPAAVELMAEIALAEEPVAAR